MSEATPTAVAANPANPAPSRQPTLGRAVAATTRTTMKATIPMTHQCAL